jgi:hypothetical protein
MIKLMLEAKELSDRQKSLPEGSRRVIGKRRRERIRTSYRQIVSEGFGINPEPPPPPKPKRGRVKRSKPLNLLIRLDQRYEEIMGFFECDHVPFDNNQSERDLRMMKVREKISGTFRSDFHASAFCDIRSIISSATLTVHGTAVSVFCFQSWDESYGFGSPHDPGLFVGVRSPDESWESSNKNRWTVSMRSTVVVGAEGGESEVIAPTKGSHAGWPNPRAVVSVIAAWEGFTGIGTI